MCCCFFLLTTIRFSALTEASHASHQISFLCPPLHIRHAIAGDKSPHMKPLWFVRGCQNNIFIPPKDPANNFCLLLCRIIAEHQVWAQHRNFFFLTVTTLLSMTPWVLSEVCDGLRCGITDPSDTASDVGLNLTLRFQRPGGHILSTTRRTAIITPAQTHCCEKVTDHRHTKCATMQKWKALCCCFDSLVACSRRLLYILHLVFSKSCANDLLFMTDMWLFMISLLL